MKIFRGKIHYYLGMTLIFSESVEVKIIMIPYIEDMVKYFANHDDAMMISATP